MAGGPYNWINRLNEPAPAKAPPRELPVAEAPPAAPRYVDPTRDAGASHRGQVKQAEEMRLADLEQEIQEMAKRRRARERLPQPEPRTVLADAKDARRAQDREDRERLVAIITAAAKLAPGESLERSELLWLAEHADRFGLDSGYEVQNLIEGVREIERGRQMVREAEAAVAALTETPDDIRGEINNIEHEIEQALAPLLAKRDAAFERLRTNEGVREAPRGAATVEESLRASLPLLFLDMPWEPRESDHLDLHALAGVR